MSGSGGVRVRVVRGAEKYASSCRDPVCGMKVISLRIGGGNFSFALELSAVTASAVPI